MDYPHSSEYWVEPFCKKVDVAVQTVTPPHSDTSQIGACVAPTRPLLPIQKNPTSISPDITFSAEQQWVIELVNSGKNVFFTGPAGTGKSLLLRHLIKLLKQSKQVAVTAPTGIAGVNIGGSTIHSFAGIGLGKESAEKLARRIEGSERLRERWCSTDVLIIDEISMMDALLFDKLEYIARQIRRSIRPFGGIQLLLSGDFFQLPPVPEQSYGYRMTSSYAFDAETWTKCIPKPIFLTQVFRQKDNAFVEILSAIRTGILKVKHIHQLQSLSRPLHYNDGVEPSQIFPLRCEVENYNNSRLTALPGDNYVYLSVDSAGYDCLHQPVPTESANVLLDRLIAVPKLSLKVNAQVMLIQNVEQGHLVNGSMGKVVEFLTVNEAVTRMIRVATLKNGPDDKEHIQLRPLNSQNFRPKEKWPLVHFINGGELLCAPLEFTIEGFMGNIEAHRLQVPLILAWALSVHKSQGQTLTRVKVDLGQIFEKGQAYVALSRATSMEHLEICNFQPSKVMANSRVKMWHDHWASQVEDPLFEEMDSEEAISRYWDDMEIA